MMIDKANSGYGDSMNHGLEMARGKYVGMARRLRNAASRQLCSIVAATCITGASRLWPMLLVKPV